MRRAFIVFAALLLVMSVAWAQEPPKDIQQAPQTQQPQDVKYTNDSVAHLSFVEGKTFVQRASDIGYEEGVLNTPISEGDRIGTTEGRAEVHFGRGNYIRLDNDTKLDVLNLPKKGDDITRLRVWSGNVYLVVGNLITEKGIEVHTADSSFYILDKGIYRINVRENKDTEILVFRGLVEAAGEGGSTLVKADQRLEISEGRFSGKPSSFMAVADDSFDNFNASRNAESGQQFAKRYLPEELGDYESELDENGQWTYQAPYGYVWSPYGVDSDWRPYWDGRWVWLGMSGWTWLPYEPWGWATFHYGRWHWGMGLGWYWIPTTFWGPGWVDWWWDDFYFGWAPLSYWGYPGVLIGGNYYGGYYGNYYPHDSRALTVIRRDQLKAPNASRVALRDPGALKGLSNMSLNRRTLSLRPVGTKISVQPLSGNRVMLRNSEGSGRLVPENGIGRESLARPSGQGAASGTSIKREGLSQSAKSAGRSSESPKVKRENSSGRSESARSSGSSKSSDSGARKIRKKEAEPSASSSGVSQSYTSSSAAARSGSASLSPRAIRTYPSSPRVTRPRNYGDGGATRSRSFIGRSTGSSSSGRSVGRSSSGRSSSGRVSSRGSSGRSSGSRGSSGARSSSGSRSSGSRRR
jgi:hypothetical protein